MAKILLIEDENILREEVADWLILEEYEVVTAANGRVGVEAAQEHLPDLILCDVSMPYLDGHGVLAALRAIPATAQIPFIFLTARASLEDMDQGIDLGADDYVTKPFTHRVLLGTIQKYLPK